MVADFKTGNVVKERGQEKLMTIHKIDDGSAECLWFAGGTLHKDTFGLEILEKVRD